MSGYFWYLRHPNEILVDLDGKNEDDVQRKLIRARRRLEGAEESRNLAVRDAYLYPSASPRHFHLIIRLQHAVQFDFANMYALYLGSDVFRACNNFMRDRRGIFSSDLLITPEEYPGFYRTPDAHCVCTKKHKADVMETCEIAQALRGKFAAYNFFAKPSTSKCWDRFGRVFIGTKRKIGR